MTAPLIPWHDASSPKWSVRHHWHHGRASGYPVCCIVWFLIREQIVEPWAGGVASAKMRCIRRLPLTDLWLWMGGRDKTLICGYVRCPWCRWIGKIGETNTVKQWLRDGWHKEFDTPEGNKSHEETKRN